MKKLLFHNDVLDNCFTELIVALSFQDFSTAIFGSVYMGHGDTCNRVGDLPLSQALCLPVAAEEIIDTCDMLQSTPEDIEQVNIVFY